MKPFDFSVPSEANQAAPPVTIAGTLARDSTLLLTVGVPIDLPESQAKSMDQDREPLTVSVNEKGQVFLQNTEIAVEDLVPKLKAIGKGGTDERIYVRGDRKVDYGTVMRVMGRLSAAGYRRVALVTEVEQGS